MVILIAGAGHSGKTLFAQKLLEKYKYPYLSIDHLKMGLIRSGHCPLSPESDDAWLTGYLWPVVREIIKTAIENSQNIIIEGSYIPADFKSDFSGAYLRHIRYVCLILSEKYIMNHYAAIKAHACDIEDRMDAAPPSEKILIRDNLQNLAQCEKHGLDYILIDDGYEFFWEL